MQDFTYFNRDGKIHFERKGADRYDMHAHIIVSRKDKIGRASCRERV